MSDRREELIRQREAVRAHLAWLDREIEVAASLDLVAVPGPAAARPTAETAAAGQPVVPSLEAADADRDVEAIMAEYRQPTLSIANQTRLGCILYFVLGLAVLIAIATAFYFGFHLHRR